MPKLRSIALRLGNFRDKWLAKYTPFRAVGLSALVITYSCLGHRQTNAFQLNQEMSSFGKWWRKEQVWVNIQRDPKGSRRVWFQCNMVKWNNRGTKMKKSTSNCLLPRLAMLVGCDLDINDNRTIPQDDQLTRIGLLPAIPGYVLAGCWVVKSYRYTGSLLSVLNGSPEADPITIGGLLVLGRGVRRNGLFLSYYMSAELWKILSEVLNKE